MTTAPAKKPITKAANKSASDSWKVLLPYGLAILAQLPMLVLYFKDLWGRPHYQPFAIAILATVGIAIYRWPFDQDQPYQRSLGSDILLVLGLGAAFLGMLFVEPWFAALSVMLLVTSLFARTLDKENQKTLWPCALPLFVYLTLPNGLDVRLITKLQLYSAMYTSKLLDLVGLGHHMNGTVIKVPVLGEFGIEQACSGVQSFFTLMLVAVIFIVVSRRLKVPSIGVGLVSVFAGFLCFVLRATVLSMPIWNEFLLLAGVGFLLMAVIGFRATTLILSAVFWAVFMNTVRIMLIPLGEYFMDVDLSHGISHDILGYSALALGILLLFSTDQFLLFLFGPVEASDREAGKFNSGITKFWNKVVSGNEEDNDNTSRRRKTRRARVPVSKSGRAFIWTTAGLVVAIGLFQFVDVWNSYNHPEIAVRFFDDDVTVDFEKGDLPELVDSWKQISHETQDRSRGSDLGQRSDVWQFRSPTCTATVSLDQPFPGWHELTTCYANQGWKLVRRTPKVPSDVLETPPDGDQWGYIEALFEKKTGEKGYLLFSHCDAFGEGMDVPAQWGTINSFIIRASNRLSHRVRASLFRGEAYQIQVFLTSFNTLDEEIKQEVNERYLKIRQELKQQFIEKKQQEDADEAA